MCLLLCSLYQCKQILCACVCVLERAKHSFFALLNPLSCSVMNKICLNQFSANVPTFLVHFDIQCTACSNFFSNDLSCIYPTMYMIVAVAAC